MMGHKQFSYLNLRIIKNLFIFLFMECLFFEKN